MEKIEPTEDRVVVRKIEDDNKSKSGLVLPDDAAERPTKGEILAAGPGRINEEGTLIPQPLKVGSHVVFPKYAGHPILINGEEFWILEYKEVLGIFHEGAE